MWIWRVAASSTSQDSALEAAGVWQQQGSAHRSGTQITTGRPIAGKSSRRIHIQQSHSPRKRMWKCLQILRKGACLREYPIDSQETLVVWPILVRFLSLVRSRSGST